MRLKNSLKEVLYCKELAHMLGIVILVQKPRSVYAL